MHLSVTAGLDPVHVYLYRRISCLQRHDRRHHFLQVGTVSGAQTTHNFDAEIQSCGPLLERRQPSTYARRAIVPLMVLDRIPRHEISAPGGGAIG